MKVKTPERPELLLINRGGSSQHWYRYRDELAPSVTTITRHGFPKPALIYWAMGQVIDYAVDNIGQLYAMVKASPEGAAKFMQQVPWTHRDRKGAIGTRIHELFLDGGEPTDDEQPYVAGLEAWFAAEQCMILDREYTVWGQTPTGTYGGKVDALVEHPTLGVGVVDIKTAEKGPYEDDHCQVAAYCSAPVGHLRAPKWGGLLHARPDGTTLHLVDVKGAMAVFEATHRIADFRGKLTTPTIDLEGGPYE